MDYHRKALLLVTYQDDDSQIVIENFSADNQISSDEKINQIYADKEKSEWILTSNGIYLITRDSKRIISFLRKSILRIVLFIK